MPKGTTSPRRLSRVRQPPLTSQSTTSTSSTTSATRQERSTRSHNAKVSSPQKSATPQSLTSEEAAAEEARASTLRRSKRTLEIDDEADAKIEDAIEDDDAIIEDEETTRCICGQLEYPGPPVDHTMRGSVKGSVPPTAAADDVVDERGGLFIQCDDCQVWQHGGCVSLMEEAEVPDNYFCEECKPDHHEVLKSPNGQNFSHYLPVWLKSHPKSARRSSVENDDKKKQTDKERSGRASALPESKRRATMNSRAAFDEDEVLRKVIEESKAEQQASTEGGSRKGKRNRDDSEDVRAGIKRQRTASSVLSSHSADSNSNIESEIEPATGLKKLPRQAAPKAATIKAEKSIEKPAPAQAEVVKRRGGRRGGNGDGEQQRGSDPSASASASAVPWKCHCNLWTCLCAPSLTRDATVDNNKAKSGSNSNSNSNTSKNNDDDAEDDSAATSTARPSAKASPVREPQVPDTPTLGSSTTVKKTGKKGGGRGRSNPAPTPSEREEKATPRNGHEPIDTDATPVPAVQVNGTAKRGKRGQPKEPQNSSGESDKDPQTTTAAQSDADIPPPRESQQHTHTHHITHAHLAGHGKKKDPSLAELKRRTAAMLDWIERAKEDIGRTSLVSLMSPSGSLSPEGVGMGGPVGGEYRNEVEGLHSRLLGWQVEYGAG